ncbi:MAG: hypothetical protein FWG64_09215 [Firmicutes bacterium]|nr:hypothetical protein [Bacillota bacterium]
MTKPLAKMPAYVSTIAAIIVLLACIAIQAELMWMAVSLSLTILVFYVIGTAARLFLLAKVFPPEIATEETAEDDDDDDDEEYEDSEDMETEPVGNAFLDS